MRVSSLYVVIYTADHQNATKGATNVNQEQVDAIRALQAAIREVANLLPFSERKSWDVAINRHVCDATVRFTDLDIMASNKH